MFKMICIFLWLLKVIHLNVVHTDYFSTDFSGIVSAARELCPYASFCEEPPLSQMPLSDGEISCCKSCSCKQDCIKRNDCCFPDKTVQNDTRSECLFSAVQQKSAPLLEIGLFKMVVKVLNCKQNFKTAYSANDNVKITRNHSTTVNCQCADKNGTVCDQCKLEDVKCGECQCYTENGLMAGYQNSIVTVGNCLCDRPINTNDCSCGEVKVAAWGSIFPVYSKTTGLIYKNIVCASCHGVNDGINWIPFIECTGNNIDHIEIIIDATARNVKECLVYFKEPENIDKSLLPRCFDLQHPCKSSNFRVLNGLNMTSEQVITACRSNFISPYNKQYKNVFCGICSDFYMPKSLCDDKGGIKVRNGRITFLLNIDFVQKKTTKPDIKDLPMACSSVTPEDCRTILCPTGKLRDADGSCVHPMSATYVVGYSVRLRLIPTEQRNLYRIKTLVAKEKVLPKHFKSPWPKEWIRHMIILESTRLMSSGILENKTAFIIQMGLPYPHRNQTRVFRNVEFLLKKKWILRVENISVELSSEFLEYKAVSKNITTKNNFYPNIVQLSDDILPTPDWTQVYAHKWSRGLPVTHISEMLLITKMMFCEQIILDQQRDGYTMVYPNTLLYFKSQNRYMFDGNFVYDRNDIRNVRVCLEDTYFVRSLSRQLQGKVNILTVIYILRIVAWVFCC